MNTKKHFILLSVGISAWALFYLIGLPSDYFREWSLADQIIISLITFFAVVPVVGFLVLLFLESDHDADYVRTALWTAFYASVPLFVLDYVIAGIVKGEGLRFLISHWYISIAYLYVWIELPIMGLALVKLKATTTDNG